MRNPWIPRWGDPAVRFNRGWLWPTRAELAAAAVQPYKLGNMQRQRWYPSAISDQILWLINFYLKLPNYETRLGLPPAHVDACVASCKFLVYVLGEWLTAVRTFGPACTQCVDLLENGSGPGPIVLTPFTAPALPDQVAAVPPGVLTRLFALVQLIKDSANYTPDIGKDLGIIATESPAPSDAQHAHPAPTVKYVLLAGDTCQQVQFNFVKHGHQALQMEGRRGTAPYEFMSVLTTTPGVDSRPLLVAGTPEVREYRFRFWDKGVLSGEWTYLKITVGPEGAAA